MGMGRDIESENSRHLQRSRKPDIPVWALEAWGGEGVKLKYNVSNVCDDESLESEKGLGKQTNKQTNKQKNTQAEEGKVE